MPLFSWRLPGTQTRNLLWMTASVVVAGACQPAGVCRVSGECPVDEICFDKSCRARCSAAADCSAGASCVQGACVYLGATCDSGDDCLSFEQCLDGRCRMLCRTDRDCQPGMLCRSGSCTLPADAGAGDGARPDGARPEVARPDGARPDGQQADGQRPDASPRDQPRLDTSASADLAVGRDASVAIDQASGDLGPCNGLPANACGGCASLDRTLGSECGSCGVVVCAGSDQTSCSDPGYNACGSCGTLIHNVGDGCGVCGQYLCDQGELLCADSGTLRFYLDQDGDGYGAAEYQDLCAAGGLYRATQIGDCDDSRGDIHPGAAELCDGLDNDCIGGPEANGSGVCRIWVASAASQTWQAWPILIVSGGHMPAPDAVFEAAFAVEGTHKLWALTHGTYHVLDVETMSWVGSGARNTLFAAAANVTLQQAYGLPTSWGDPDPHADVTLADGSTAWIYDYDAQYDTFTLTQTTGFSWTGANAPNPAALSDVWIDVYNTASWAPAGNPNAICGAESYAVGPYLGCLAGTTLHFMEATCFTWYHQVAASNWLAFNWQPAPAPQDVEALAWIDGKLIVFAR